MLIGSPHKLCNPSFTTLNFKVANSNLDDVSNFKHLGVSINRTMTWHDHVERISKKINQRLGLFRRIKYVLPHQARLSFYHSLVLPLFDYADIIWGDKDNTTLMENLQILQNKAAKLILNLPLHKSATQALKTLGWCRL